MRPIRYIASLLIIISLLQCHYGDDPIVNPEPVKTGVLEIDFKLPPIPLPDKGIHRIDLSLARNADSLYRNLFIASANVTDSKNLYRFILAPGTYYYRAGITCSCLSDSCLWGGFPGGRFGQRWAIDRVEVTLGGVTRESPSFQ